MSAVLKAEESDCRVWRDETIALPDGFTLESGERLSAPFVRLRFYGDRAQPIIAVGGGISAGRAVADAGEEKGWWADYVGPRRAIDLNNACVLGFDFLPNEEEAARVISTADQARALEYALSELGIDRLAGFVGSSYGGMVALAFAAAYPEKVGALIVISAAERPHPFGTALRGVQRRIVEFSKTVDAEGEGVSLARQLAMITYRSPTEFSARFDYAPGPNAGDPHPVCDYLISRGDAFSMAPDRFVTLSDSIDRHHVDLAKIRARTMFVAVQGDQLAPPSDIRRCAAAVARARYVEIVSIYGHDAFLKEAASIGPFIQNFLKEYGK